MTTGIQVRSVAKVAVGERHRFCRARISRLDMQHCNDVRSYGETNRTAAAYMDHSLNRRRTLGASMQASAAFLLRTYAMPICNRSRRGTVVQVRSFCYPCIRSGPFFRFVLATCQSSGPFSGVVPGLSGCSHKDRDSGNQLVAARCYKAVTPTVCICCPSARPFHLD